MSNAAQSARLMLAAPSFIHFLDFGSGQQAFSTTELHMPQDHIRTRQQLQDPRVPATQAEEAISSGQSLHHSATHCLEKLPSVQRLHEWLASNNFKDHAAKTPQIHCPGQCCLQSHWSRHQIPQLGWSVKGRHIFCEAWLGCGYWACNCCPFSLRCRRFGWTVDRGLWTWKARCRL